MQLEFFVHADAVEAMMRNAAGQAEEAQENAKAAIDNIRGGSPADPPPSKPDGEDDDPDP